MRRMYVGYGKGISIAITFIFKYLKNTNRCKIIKIAAAYGNSVHIFEPTPSAKKSTHVT
jgi:hypothetical protein